MHPFYEPSAGLLSDRRTVPAGLWSMAAYLVFWAAAIPMVLVALRRVLAVAPGTVEDGATAILRERFARGEIDTEEYRQRLEVLGGARSARSS